MVEIKLGKKREEKTEITSKAKELTLLEIEETKNRIQSHILENYTDEKLLELIMYELLLFSSTHHDDETLLKQTKKYYTKNKEELQYKIP